MATRMKFIDLVRTAVAKGGTGDVWLDRDYEVEDPVLVFDVAGLRIRGKNGFRPVLYWTGNARHMLDFANCRDTLLDNFCIEVHGALDGHALHYWRKVTGRTTPTNNKHRGIAMLVRLGGYCLGFASHDIMTDKGQPANLEKEENNEFALYEDIDVDGAAYGLHFIGQQSHGHVITRCRFNVKQTAITSSGWFSATDVSGSGLSGPAFHTNGISAPIHIVRPNFEATQRLLVAEGPNGFHGDSQPILIEGGSTRCDQLHTDKKIVILRHAGPLRFAGHQFGSGKQPVPFIETSLPGCVTVESCVVGSWGSHGLPFIRRLDNAEDHESKIFRTYYHLSTGEPVKCPGWI